MVVYEVTKNRNICSYYFFYIFPCCKNSLINWMSYSPEYLLIVHVESCRKTTIFQIQTLFTVLKQHFFLYFLAFLSDLTVLKQHFMYLGRRSPYQNNSFVILVVVPRTRMTLLHFRRISKNYFKAVI